MSIDCTAASWKRKNRPNKTTASIHSLDYSSQQGYIPETKTSATVSITNKMSGTKAGKGPSTIKRRKRGHDEEEDETAMEDESTLFVSTASNTARNDNRSALAAPSNAGQAEQIISLMAEIAALKEGIQARDATLEALKPTSLQILLHLGSLTM
jgi:hypothetical protein